MAEGEDIVELAATLLPTTANPKDLDAITARLIVHAEVESATWIVSTES